MENDPAKTRAHTEEPSAPLPDRTTTNTGQLDRDIVSLATKLDDKSEEVLITLYEQHAEHARMFNVLIWTITGVFLPASLGGQLMSFRSESGVFYQAQLWSVALGSMLTILFWYLFTILHKTHLLRTLYVVRCIEAKWKLRDEPVGLSSVSTSLLSVWDFGAHLRLSMFLLVCAAWIVRLVLEYWQNPAYVIR